MTDKINDISILCNNISFESGEKAEGGRTPGTAPEAGLPAGPSFSETGGGLPSGHGREPSEQVVLVSGFLQGDSERRLPLRVGNATRPA